MTGRAATAATEEFRRARDLLLATRSDHEAACREFRWPRPETFNWALEWFDVLAAGPDRTCLELVEPDGTVLAVSYAEMSTRSDAVARWLTDQGVRRGDRVLVVLNTRRELWECLLACLKTGAVAIPTYPSLTPTEAADRLRRGRIRHVVCEADRAGLFTDGPHDGVRVAVGSPVPGWRSYADAFAPARPFDPDGPTPAGDIAFCYFTSGTTAAPKLVAHTHTSYPVGHLSSMYFNGLLPGDRHLNVSAPGWAKHSWSSLFVPWNAQATVVADTLPPDPARLARLLVDRDVDSLCAPPSVWHGLAPLLRTVRPALREATSAGEPLDPSLADRVRRAWGVTVRDGYGQTETTALVGTTPGMTPRPGWLGRALPGFDVRVGGARRGPATGEITVDLSAAPVGMTRGYLGDAGRTEEAFADGVYHTGDLADVDGDGWIRVSGRRDDVFKSYGHRVSPYELEAVLRGHPAVAEVAVVAWADPVGTLVPHAVVVAHVGGGPADAGPADGGPADGGPADGVGLARDLLDYLRERVAPAICPRAVHLTDRLPRTASGKIRRRAVAEWVAATIGGTPAAPPALPAPPAPPALPAPPAPPAVGGAAYPRHRNTGAGADSAGRVTRSPYQEVTP